MSIKTIALVKRGSVAFEVIGNKSIKVSGGEKEEKTVRFDGAAEIDSDVKEAFNSFIKPRIQIDNKVTKSANNSFISFSTDNETFLASLDGSTGVIDLSADQFFNFSPASQQQQLVSVSMLSIGNDGSLHDLLNPHTRSMKLEQHSKMGLRVEGLSQLVVESADELTKLFVDGLKVMASLRIISLACLFNVHVKMAPQDLQDGKIVETSTKFLHFNLNSKDGENVKKVVNQIKEKKTIQEHLALNMLLQDCIVNHSACIIAELRGKNQPVEALILEIAESLRGFESLKKNPRADYNNIIAVNELRKEIDLMREKIFDQNIPNIVDVDHMERLVKDLEICKTDSWDQMILCSIHAYHERNINFADRGIGWILESKTQVTPEKVLAYQKQLNELTEKFQKQRLIVEQTNKELKIEIENYSNQISLDKSSSSQPSTSAVQKLKDKSRKEGDKLRLLRNNLHKCRQQLQTSAQEGMNETAGSFNISIKSLLDDRNKFRSENKNIVDEELKRMELVIKHEKSKLSTPNDDEEKIELIKLRAEKAVLTTQLEVLKKERDQSDQDINIIVERHQKDLQLLRVHNLQVFRSYKQVCDEYKLELESRWRSLLDDSIKDAVFLKARNQEILLKNARLEKENAEMRDQLTMK